MTKSEVARLLLAPHKGYGAKGFPAWGYPFTLFYSMYRLISYIKLFREIFDAVCYSMKYFKPVNL